MALTARPVWTEDRIDYLYEKKGNMTMSTLKALIAVKADLASSIAIRYACQLAKLTGLGLQTLFVVKPDEPGHTPGTGWVREGRPGRMRWS